MTVLIHISFFHKFFFLFKLPWWFPELVRDSDRLTCRMISWLGGASIKYEISGWSSTIHHSNHLHCSGDLIINKGYFADFNLEYWEIQMVWNENLQLRKMDGKNGEFQRKYNSTIQTYLMKFQTFKQWMMIGFILKFR